MSQKIVNNIKKNVLLIALIILCAFLLSLCSANSNSNQADDNSVVDLDKNQNPQKTETDNFSFDNLDNSGLSGPAGTELFYKTMLALALVVIMGTAAIFLTKKLMPKIANISGREIQIIETVYLGPRKSVHLLEINKRRFLIGSTNEHISKLADLTEFSTDISINESGN